MEDGVNIDGWRAFWQHRADPEHRSSSPDHYDKYGRELSLIIGDVTDKRVLELGCGSGSLFGPLGFNLARAYRGVDFSKGMLAKFKSFHPQADLICADASTYRDNQLYDLVFSNAVAQYFDQEMFRRSIESAVHMLAPGGKIFIGSVPWKAARRGYYLGELCLHARRATIRDVVVYAASFVRSDPLGRWYSLAEVSEVAERLKVSVEFFGSIFYPYRFHARLRAIPHQ